MLAIAQPRSRRAVVALVAGAALAAGAGAATLADPDPPPARAHPAGAALGAQRPRAASCASRSADRRSAGALLAAERRFALEAEGATIHRDLRQIAHDRALLQALSAGDSQRATVAAERQLVRHVVRIRVVRDGRALLDANATSFDVAGAAVGLRGAHGSSLGQLQITVQDVIGFDKLVHRRIHADVLVRASGGAMRTTLPAAARAVLPASGCLSVGARRYLVRSFARTDFTGEALEVWVLTPA